jgi:beta-phosphoglucomutase-like phosphatase (HAD superfamily)
MTSAVPTTALIFDMDGTMIDSMPWHQKSWVEFCKLQGVDIDVPDLMRRTTGRNGAECMAELFGRALSHDESWELVRVKEELYRDMFSPVFAEVAGFKTFAGQAELAGPHVVASVRDYHELMDQQFLGTLHATT